MAIKILGVDFRENTVSAVLIRGSYKGMWLEAHAHVLLEQPENLEKGLESCLETVSGQADISSAVCVVAIPSDRFFFEISPLHLQIRKKSIKHCPMNSNKACRFPLMIC